ncbi:GreA/GreB family elongation factor [Candidatus Similichlamydia laticola]|uniref:Transcription elongation factor GreA n=1 Tax=Candidatus Similichlamydia laticola TaxID=2170265 RepID=A0A369KH93_9BACT|nr:GreA/GreB family elongation factor [Candidatus Similichlamydia laticola]RDB31163.1 Transcription elongation factor GreA [Candidatus Similichlamydia laticola]
MNYLEEFRSRIKDNNIWQLMQLWEEYCCCDVIEAEELRQILSAIHRSPLEQEFGQYVETAIPLWEQIKKSGEKDEKEIINLIFDLQTSNSELFGDLAIKILSERYGSEKDFEANLAIVSLKPMKDFRGALRNFELLRHLRVGHFVYHKAGWGVGEILDTSPICEQASIEFENVSGVKHITFRNAFRTLIPIEKSHFLARRFGNADAFEKEARENPVEAIYLLLKDLGPKTALGIKDELCELIIPQNIWSSWWQSTRSKLKKEDRIECPTGSHGYFRIRKKAKSREELLEEEVQGEEPLTVLMSIYSFVRDFPDRLEQPLVRENLIKHLETCLSHSGIKVATLFELKMLLSDLNSSSYEDEMKRAVLETEDVLAFFSDMSITSFRKRFLLAIVAYHKSWPSLFATLFLNFPLNSHREFLLKQLVSSGQVSTLLECVHNMIAQPQSFPEALVWFFQKAVNEPLSFLDKGKLCSLLEAVLVLLHQIENLSTHRAITRKIHSVLTSNRYLITRKVIDQTSLEFLKEFLLLVSKCHTFSSHDLHIIQSLAEVVQPEMKEFKRFAQPASSQEETIWTTEAGLESVKQKINRLYSEILKSANEIEDARALGDLRENSEFKFALERRGQLQSEVRFLLDQVKRAKILSPEGVSKESVQVGCQVHLSSKDGQGPAVSYSILGPWDADADQQVISHQSKIAQQLIGKRVGESIELNGQYFTLESIGLAKALI